jgi:hypothetical protein
MKLTKERLWWLKQFQAYGWSIGRPDMCATKKWSKMSEDLIKIGLLEREDEYGSLRVTEAGRAALKEMGE